MDTSENHRRNVELIKFVASTQLKQQAQHLAAQRNISLSALLRLVLSEYVRNRA